MLSEREVVAKNMCCAVCFHCAAHVAVSPLLSNEPRYTADDMMFYDRVHR